MRVDDGDDRERCRRIYYLFIYEFTVVKNVNKIRMTLTEKLSSTVRH